MKNIIYYQLLIMLLLTGCFNNSEKDLPAHKNLEQQKIEDLKKLAKFKRSGKLFKKPKVALKKIFFHITKSDEKAIEKLIKEKIDFNNKTLKGITPLHIAASKSNSTIIKLLLKGGANANIVNNFGLKPIAYVQKKENFEVLKGVTTVVKNDPSIAKSECFLFAWKSLDSKYTSSCVTIGNYYNDKKVYQHAGWFYLIAKELDRSIQANLNFLKNNENSMKSALTLAHAYTLKGEYKKAKNLYKYFYIKGKRTTFKMKQNYIMLSKIYKEKSMHIQEGKKIWKQLSGDDI